MSIQRKAYLANEVTHEEYYSQFVNQPMQELVVSYFGGLDTLKKAYARDKHLNSLPLLQWDALAYWLNNPAFRAKLKEAGDVFSLSTAVCTLKQAAVLAIQKETQTHE